MKKYEAPSIDFYVFEMPESIMGSGGCSAYDAPCPSDGNCYMYGTCMMDSPSCSSDGECILDGVCFTDLSSP